MKVYLLILSFCMDGTEDTNVEVYATRELAMQHMKEEFELTKKEYEEVLNDYDLAGEVSIEDCIACEPYNDGASIMIPDGWMIQKYDTWRIVEQEVKGPKQYVLTEELYKKLSKWHEQCYEEHPNGDMVYTDGELLDGAINLYEQISELTRQQSKK